MDPKATPSPICCKPIQRSRHDPKDTKGSPLSSLVDINVIVLSSTGDHFCAGIDLKTLTSISEKFVSVDRGRVREQFRREIKWLQDAITAIERCRKPVIASIHGACIGGGIDIVTACDIRYCSKDAFFSVKEVDLVITADLGTLQRLPGIVGYGNAIELALTGRRFSGPEAKQLGLVSGVFDCRDELENGVRLIAEGIGSKSPLAVTGTKAVLQRSRELNVEHNTVPEGDWFCLDCTTIRGEHDDNVDSSSDSDDEYLLGPSDPNISAFDIVQESYGHSSAANRYLPRIPRIPDHFALPVVRDRSTSIADEVITTPAETLPSVAASGARTLVHRRYVCTRVQELRENWNAIQSGSLSFTSSSIKSGCISSQKPKNGVIIHERSGQTQSSSSTSGQQPRNRDSCGLSDIDKAWKMMEIAKSRMDAGKKCSGSSVSTTSDSRKRTNVNPCFGTSSQAQSSSSAGCHRPINQVGCGKRDIKSKQHVHTNTGSSSGVQHPKLISGISSASQEATNVTSSSDILRSQQLGACDRRKTGKESYKCSPREKETIRHQPVKLEKDTQFRVMPQDAVARSEGPSARHIKQAAANIIHEQNRSACSVNEGAPSSFYAKPEISTSSSKLDAQKRNIGRGESCVEGQSRKDAKSEIASVVKVNLKMLTKDKPLGVDAFKEIARLSTHTIYGACGLKRSKSGMYSFPSLECPHTEQFQPPHKPSPMPNSCRACFDGFVKGVVSSILCGSAGSAKLSRAPS